MPSTENQKLLLGAAQQAGITDRQELANFMAQMQVESGGFARMHENLNYSAAGLLRTFPGRNGMDTPQEAQAIASKGPRGVAEAIYGGAWGRENLGNTEAGDGWRFHGRGFVHLTGRENYERYGRQLGVDLAGNPDLAADPGIAARIAVAYWHERVERRGHDRDVTAATRDINGGTNGLAERRVAAAQWEDRLASDALRQGQGQANTTPSAEPTRNVQAPGVQPDSGIRLSAAYAMGQRYDDVQYAINIKGHRLYRGDGIDGKHLDQGYIDCSGWVTALQNETMAEINKAAGREVFSRADLFNPGNDGSGTIVKKAFERSGNLLEGDAVRQSGALKEGMVIGVDSARTQHDHWKGIDHVVMVVRNPDTGGLMVSQSTGSKGVHMMPLNDYLDANRNTKLFAADPLSKARDLLQERQQSLGERSTGEALPAYGERGPAVKALQENLKSIGVVANDGTGLSGTGYYGEKTKEVVANFQRQNGITPTGAADKATLEAIDRKLGMDKVADGAVPAVGAKSPLLSEPAHPNHALYADVSRRLSEQTGTAPKPEVTANITMQLMENGIRQPADIQGLAVRGTDVHVQGPVPGARLSVDLNAPTASLQAISEHTARQSQERAALERQNAQAQASTQVQ